MTDIRSYLVKAADEASEGRRVASRAEYAAKRAIEVFDAQEVAVVPTPVPTRSTAIFMSQSHAVPSYGGYWAGRIIKDNPQIEWLDEGLSSENDFVQSYSGISRFQEWQGRVLAMKPTYVFVSTMPHDLCRNLDRYFLFFSIFADAGIKVITNQPWPSKQLAEAGEEALRQTAIKLLGQWVNDGPVAAVALFDEDPVLGASYARLNPLLFRDDIHHTELFADWENGIAGGHGFAYSLWSRAFAEIEPSVTPYPYPEVTDAHRADYSRPDPVEPPPPPAEPIEEPDPAPEPLPTEHTGEWLVKEDVPALDSFESDEEYRSHLRRTTGGLVDNKTDPVGAFRLDDVINKIGLMDPVFRPGMRPAHHLHGFFQNGAVDEHTTWESLGQTDPRFLHSRAGLMDHSAIWVPLVFAVHRETRQYTAITEDVRMSRYYKDKPDFSRWQDVMTRSPDFAAWVQRLKERKPWEYEFYANTPLVELPHNLRFIIGIPNGTNTIGVFSDPGGPKVSDAIAKKSFKRFEDLVGHIQPGQRVKVSAQSSNLWDGKHLDSPDHASHMAHRHNGDRDGTYRPVDGFPVRVPIITIAESYLIPEWADLSQPLMISSDLQTGSAGGDTAHKEYVERWERRAKADWHEHAINGHRNCSFGNLGNGWATIGGPPPDPATYLERFPPELLTKPFV